MCIYMYMYVHQWPGQVCGLGCGATYSMIPLASVLQVKVDAKTRTDLLKYLARKRRAKEGQSVSEEEVSAGASSWWTHAA